ncbi:Gfo/Idh/MocA family protein [Novipirellula artificiosorum]|uniref:Inositol 2-dehydrogenase n=1 Tax=Novipirellula artificiosorum TaxID=2528016 RepID=A0A5C6DT82_9BACT|nr:Gfo/Idh/MocA family oxidoreductase [Novipirellula artificiosorum]TWU38236.1 Inositol 2-dehydrogenase [Novipirellula artificiosorum]
MQNINRRQFLTQSAAVSTAATILPRYAVGQSSPSEKLNLAVIGCTNRGGNIGSEAIKNSLTHCVALCDVVPSRAEGLKKKMGGRCDDAIVFEDFREMLSKMGDKIDACTIGVPDHAHFPIAMLAMSMGIHVYVEKPLAHTFEECELLMAAEKKYKVKCQMGNQGHSSGQRLQFQSWVEAGIIKNVRRVDACMNKGRRWHPWGDIKEFPPAEKMPEGMNWDVWAGTAPKHPYNSKYDPGNWRGWYDYGNGAFGDWGPHTLDTVHRFLKLGLPHEIRAEKIEKPNDLIYPHGTTIAFDFAQRGPDMPEMTINWYDGTHNRPPSSHDVKIPSCGKAIFSDDLTFVGGTHSASLSIVGGERQDDVKDSLPKSSASETSTNHMDNFLRAAAGLDPYCNSSFAITGPLTQVFMLGCIAQRLGEDLEFDTETKQITNSVRANELLKGHAPRPGWEAYYELA